ncbi:hypothetical protein SAMN06309944_1725 [Micrococcales bacterium KH10]|nr:hypothetical protein SAMN06309944_1725 [Micrococcales bacterium KH10]
MAVIVSAALIATGMLATSATMANAAPAPGTIVFIKNKEVWMAKGDGTGQIQVSNSGQILEYRSPTMADDGTILALKSNDVVRMKTDGTILNTWPAGTLFPPSEAQNSTQKVHVSPDGKKVALGLAAIVSGGGFGGWDIAYGTQFSASHQRTNLSPTRLYYKDAKWISNNRVIMVNDETSQESIALFSLTDGAPTTWFDDSDIFPSDYPLDQIEPELSADGTRLVTLRGYMSDRELIVYTVTGNARTGIPAKPTVKCVLGSGGDNKFENPTISSNNKALAWEMSGGIWIKNDLNNCATSDARLAIPGGSDPSWSKAAYKVPKKASNSSPKAAKKKFKVVKKPKIKGKAKVSKTLKVTKGKWKKKPTKFKYQWLRGKKKIKAATKVKYKVKKADRRKKLRVKVTVKRNGFANKKITVTTKKIR